MTEEELRIRVDDLIPLTTKPQYYRELLVAVAKEYAFALVARVDPMNKMDILKEIKGDGKAPIDDFVPWRLRPILGPEDVRICMKVAPSIVGLAVSLTMMWLILQLCQPHYKPPVINAVHATKKPSHRVKAEK